MSSSSEKLNAWHAELDKQNAERLAARAKKRQQQLANTDQPVMPAPAEPPQSQSDADHETSRGIRSVWD